MGLQNTTERNVALNLLMSQDLIFLINSAHFLAFSNCCTASLVATRTFVNIPDFVLRSCSRPAPATGLIHVQQTRYAMMLNTLSAFFRHVEATFASFS